MVNYIQLEKFHLNNKGNAKINIVKKAFANFSSKQNIEIIDLFDDNFYNGIFNEKKIISIYYFNLFLNNQPQIKSSLDNYVSCTNAFYRLLKNNNSQLINIIKKDLAKIINYIGLRNKYLEKEIYKDINILNLNFMEPIWNKYYLLLEDYIIMNYKDLYFKEVVNIKSIYFDFLKYIEETYKDKNKNIQLTHQNLDHLKKDNIIIDKYMNCLFNELSFDDIVFNLKKDNNNLMIFSSMKNKYFENFLTDHYQDLDTNLYINYQNSELFNSISMYYSLYKGK